MVQDCASVYEAAVDTGVVLLATSIVTEVVVGVEIVDVVVL